HVDAVGFGAAAVVVQAQVPAAAEVVAGTDAVVRLGRALVVDDVEAVLAQLQGDAGHAGAGADEEAGFLRAEVLLGDDAGADGDRGRVVGAAQVLGVQRADVALDGAGRGGPVGGAHQQRGAVVAAAEVAAAADFDVAVAGFGADEGLA